MPSFPPVRSIERAFDVLAYLNRRPVSRIQDLQQDTGLPAATLVRILETLCGLGYVARHSRQAGYVVCEKVRQLSCGFHGLPRLIERARPALSALTGSLLWPAALATLDGNSMVVQLSTIPDSPLAHTHSTLQKRLDLLTRAHGRAYLAFCPAPERKRLLTQLSELQFSRLSPQDLEDRMQPVLAQIRHLGFAERDHEIDPQTTSLAMPVRLGANVIATIGLTFFRGGNPDRRDMLGQLAFTAAEIEKVMPLDRH